MRYLKCYSFLLSPCKIHSKTDQLTNNVCVMCAASKSYSIQLSYCLPVCPTETSAIIEIRGEVWEE